MVKERMVPKKVRTQAYKVASEHFQGVCEIDYLP